MDEEDEEENDQIMEEDEDEEESDNEEGDEDEEAGGVEPWNAGYTSVRDLYTNVDEEDGEDEGLDVEHEDMDDGFEEDGEDEGN